MPDFSLDDTIVAISTPLGFGGIGVLRLSGANSLRIAKAIFHPKTARATISPGLAVFGHFLDIAERKPLDDGFLIFFRAPNSYTREDMVEVSLHGSPVVLESALRSAISMGARAAHPGEFTMRAVLRGRYDIIQADAINDLIHAPSLDTARLAYRQMEGKLSAKINDLRRRLIELLADIEAFIEFPDEKLPLSSQKIAKSVERTSIFLKDLVASYDFGKALFEGVTLALVGRTNVGKSTLFNAILEEDRAIVTPHPGTTRDYLKEKFNIRDAHFSIVDMAGLGKTSLEIEKEGVLRGHRIAGQADGVLILFDTSRKETRADRGLIEEFGGRKAIVVFNKIDLPRKMHKEIVKKWMGRVPSVKISALEGTNLDLLKSTIYKTFGAKKKDSEYIIFHLRQKLELEDILESCRKAVDILRHGGPEEFYAEEIRKAIKGIGRLTGEIRSDDVLQDIFSRFCVGK